MAFELDMAHCCHWEKPCSVWPPSSLAGPPRWAASRSWVGAGSQRNALGCGAAEPVGNRRNDSHAMDSNDPYLHLSKYRAVPGRAGLSERWLLLSLFAAERRSCFMASSSWNYNHHQSLCDSADFTRSDSCSSARARRLGEYSFKITTISTCCSDWIVASSQVTARCAGPGKVRGWHFNCGVCNLWRLSRVSWPNSLRQKHNLLVWVWWSCWIRKGKWRAPERGGMSAWSW